MGVSFRVLDFNDLLTMFEWLQKPHVKQWWNDGHDSVEKVKAHYFDSEDEVERFILMNTDGHSIGYFQSYWLSDNLIGIDQFIGDDSLINQGVGTNAIKMFTSLLFERLNPDSIVLDPDPSNHRAIRCYEKVGFRFYSVEVLDDGKQAYMMKLERNADR
jgi:RimJ/RimL family protein N-acetyltransferase